MGEGSAAEQDAVCAALERIMSSGDERIDYAVSMTVPVERTTVMALNPAGKYITSEGKANSPLETEELRTALTALRKASYRPGIGTWFSDPIAYVTDQEHFPRDEQHQPEWLKAKLAEGRSRLAIRAR